MRRTSLFAPAAWAVVLAPSAIVACAHEPSPSPRAAPPLTAPPACRHPAATCAGAPPSYSGEVRPILEARCFHCHANGGEAADEHDFSHVETLRAQKLALASEIGACAMPPSPEPPLPAAEAETLLQWAACGALDR